MLEWGIQGKVEGGMEDGCVNIQCITFKNDTLFIDIPNTETLAFIKDLS